MGTPGRTRTCNLRIQVCAGFPTPWTIPSPYPRGDVGGGRLVSTPSVDLGFPRRKPRVRVAGISNLGLPGLARDCPRAADLRGRPSLGFPEFDHVHAANFSTAAHFSQKSAALSG